jgi:predicted ATPase
MENFTLHVEDFGKIDSATVELAPLTLFVGDNNSGKSYLMALIYGLFAWDPIGTFDTSSPDALYFNSLIREMLSNDSADQLYMFSEDDYMRLEKMTNEFLEGSKMSLVTRIFNREIPIGKMQIKLNNDDRLSFSVHKILGAKNTVEETHVSLKIVNTGETIATLRLTAYDMQSDTLFMRALSAYSLGWYQHTPIFLPASRTGFMLTYRSLIKHSIEKSFLVREDEKTIYGATVLTKPCIDFLSHVSGFSYEQQKQEYRKDITDFIENNILHGKLSANQLPTPDITYIPNGLDERIPMHVSSGVVTETAPLVLALSNSAIDYLQIEEPEMCLHPGLQKKMARALIRIVNSGMPVLASTHSDIILQHVNNILRLKNHPNREKIMRKLGYDEQDLLDAKDVKVYQFDSNETRSSVKEIKFDPEDGFVAPTFINSLSDLLDETTQILREDQ